MRLYCIYNIRHGYFVLAEVLKANTRTLARMQRESLQNLFSKNYVIIMCINSIFKNDITKDKNRYLFTHIRLHCPLDSNQEIR